MDIVYSRHNIPIVKHVGRRIAMARRAAGLTQRQLAECLGIHWNTVARWERGEISPSINVLANIAFEFQRGLPWFFK